MSVSDSTFTDLAEGGGGAAGARELGIAQRSRRTLLIRGVFEESQLNGHPDAPFVADAYEHLLALEKSAPRQVESILQHPAVGAWALGAYRSLRQGGADRPARLGAVALAASAATGVSCRIRVRIPEDGVLMLPSLGLLSLGVKAAGDAEVEVRPDETGAVLAGDDWTARVEPGADDDSGWQALHRVRVDQGFEVVVDDLDPYRWPDEVAVVGRLGEEERRHWESCLRAAWHVLREWHPVVAEELRGIVQVITPIKAPPQGGDNSASSRDTFGTVAMSAPRHGTWLAATLAHELQHAKLEALNYLIPLIRHDRNDHFYAPWRPDPRPGYGLLHGAYAYLGVTEFWRRQHRHETGELANIGQAEFARWREGVRLVTDTLRREELLTEAGEAFVAGMRRTLDPALSIRVTASAQALADSAAARHRAAWLVRNSSAG
ncbi:HEXXH motif domain-containing protein [Acrocarpospora corrugata]|uniref:HEXXH motif domain-containing protein n=1 Tax=Acrocarpospora corrugata TaxID=35763 RepID=A0A5M3W7P6_9ACTN|nr:HEXXH motif domain-containing protein [Acrocarpospora corrugata]GES04826.1 HEXXH motif domain-containing protein [Acrocarpospora corrugata]